MDLTSQSAAESDGNGVVSERKAVDDQQQAPPPYVSMVDPFLVEALQNPRHRLTILRMELDVQNFLQNSDMEQFEFPHFPTSYLRLAAHRVAQHYGLQTMVLDNSVESQGIRIRVLKKADSKFPALCLSDVPAKKSENDKLDQLKIVIRPRPKGSSNNSNELGLKRSPVRSVEERKEEYDRARSRIFSSPSSSESDDTSFQIASEVRNVIVNENEVSRNLAIDVDKSSFREVGNSSKVAILRDREKDRSDPDYDRSYDRYVTNLPNKQSFNTAPFNMQKFQPPLVHYNSSFPHHSQVPAPQGSLNYGNHMIGPYCAMGLNHASTDTLYVQWPTQSMIFQAPLCQQPLSFDYLQNHR
ncbi:R3H domain-containing protein 2-like [Salvia divinorum]|uniref:R3H domain-containing protein 2-like n=1 Tax=Salvia divinorum TaxID=28513 RepID=A0ABD1I6V9_SALDI